ncbi:hypothetical protein MRX96_002389 [Rhipicephalus microplus]
MSGTPATQRNQPHSGIHPNASLPATEMTGTVTSGPYHRAIKPGTFSTTFEFRDVPSKLRESLVSRKTVETIEAEVIKIGGYAVGLESEFREDDEGAINATFIPYLRGSNVERDLDWLSNKKAHNCWVEGRRSEPVSWYELENKGHAFGDTLYVTLQLE